MDIDNTWVVTALSGILPEQTFQILHDHVLHPSSTVRTVSSQAVLALQRAAAALQPVAAPVIDRGMRMLHDSPDIVFFGFLLTLLFLAFQVVMWVQRTISFFTRLAFRAVFWAFVGLALMAVWQRGPEAVARDLFVIGSRLVGYATVVKDIWLNEYQKYDAQTRTGSASSGSRSSGYNSGRRRGWA
ncbi:hypothetical protein F5Y17DRAFT_454082 [Xylariaceae sp. FL0594]|nr:hypothetical protein F5Y17DRAFT_454082 [Xylariaceae sp. FL0594]